MKIGYLGPEGTFTHEAVIKHYPDEQHVPILGIEECIKRLKEDSIDISILPKINSISNVDELLIDRSLKIIKTMHEKINMSIGGLDDFSENKIICSKNYALMQCTRFLSDYYDIEFDNGAKEFIEKLRSLRLIEETISTSKAMEDISKNHDLSRIAIGSKNGLLRYGLNVYLENINDKKRNITTFVALRNKI